MCNCSGYSGKTDCMKCKLLPSAKGALLFALLASPMAYDLTKQNYLVHAVVFFILSYLISMFLKI